MNKRGMHSPFAFICIVLSEGQSAGTTYVWCKNMHFFRNVLNHVLNHFGPNKISNPKFPSHTIYRDSYNIIHHHTSTHFSNTSRIFWNKITHINSSITSFLFSHRSFHPVPSRVFLFLPGNRTPSPSTWALGTSADAWRCRWSREIGTQGMPGTSASWRWAWCLGRRGSVGDGMVPGAHHFFRANMVTIFEFWRILFVVLGYLEIATWVWWQKNCWPTFWDGKSNAVGDLAKRTF